MISSSCEVLERSCNGKACYEVIERDSDTCPESRFREFFLLDARSTRYLLSQGTVGPTGEFEKNEVRDEVNRALIGSVFASQSLPKKSFNVLYSTDSPGEVDRYFAQNDQFNVTTLISDLSALGMSRRWMGVEMNGVKYVHDPSGQYLDVMQANGELFDVYIIDRCDISRGSRQCPAQSVIDFDRLHFFTSLLKPNGILIIRLSSGESSAQMAEMAIGDQFSTCYKYPEEQRKRGEVQLLICSLLPVTSPWEHLRRTIEWKEAAQNLPRFSN